MGADGHDLVRLDLAAVEQGGHHLGILLGQLCGGQGATGELVRPGAVQCHELCAQRSGQGQAGFGHDVDLGPRGRFRLLGNGRLALPVAARRSRRGELGQHAVHAVHARAGHQPDVVAALRRHGGKRIGQGAVVAGRGCAAAGGQRAATVSAGSSSGVWCSCASIWICCLYGWTACAKALASRGSSLRATGSVTDSGSTGVPAMRNS